MWKMTFFSLRWSWNDFKVKYAWIEVKMCLQAIFGVNGGIEWGFRGGLKTVKMLKNCSKLVFSDPHKITLSDPIDPNFFSEDSFWLQFKYILLWNHLKILWDWKMSIFTYHFNLLSKIRAKSLHNAMGPCATWVFGLDSIFLA